MVARNLSIPHEFVCLTNVNIDGVHTIPLRHRWPGWWSKIELFGPALRSADRVMYLDLDVLITGSLDEMASHPAPIIFLPPHHKILGIPPTPKKGVVRKYQSSCILWSPPVGQEIFDRFTDSAMENFRGDQDWIATTMPDCATWDLSVVCKLSQCSGNGPPKNVRIVLAVGGKNEEAARRWRWARKIWYGETEPSLS
jgi:hypothetical protein